MATKVQNYLVARLCWNSANWQQPTGADGKSRHPDTFEAQHGFGHEEWLFDFSQLVQGYKYGFIQALNHSNGTRVGQTLSLLLYTLNSTSKQRYWVGALESVEVLTSKKARSAIGELGPTWMKEMGDQLRALGVPSAPLGQAKGIELINVRFRPNSLRIFDPVPFATRALRSYRYGTLQRVPPNQALVLSEAKQAEVIEQNLKTTKTKRLQYEGETEVDLVQTQWQLRLKKTLPRDLPKDVKVKIECKVEGHRLDAMLEGKKSRIFIELKTKGTARKVIRDALSQLMDYAYRPNADRCDVLLIVGGLPAGKEDRLYLSKLRKDFKLPVHYLQYQDGHIVGIASWCAQWMPE